VAVAEAGGRDSRFVEARGLALAFLVGLVTPSRRLLYPAMHAQRSKREGGQAVQEGEGSSRGGGEGGPWRELGVFGGWSRQRPDTTTYHWCRGQARPRPHQTLLSLPPSLLLHLRHSPLQLSLHEARGSKGWDSHKELELHTRTRALPQHGTSTKSGVVVYGGRGHGDSVAPARLDLTTATVRHSDVYTSHRRPLSSWQNSVTSLVTRTWRYASMYRTTLRTMRSNMWFRCWAFDTTTGRGPVLPGGVSMYLYVVRMGLPSAPPRYMLGGGGGAEGVHAGAEGAPRCHRVTASRVGWGRAPLP
jgi:hypothetical protein